MNTLNIDIMDLARYKHGGYLVHMAPKVKFLNLCLSDSHIINIGKETALAFLYNDAAENPWDMAKNYMKELAAHESLLPYLPADKEDCDFSSYERSIEILFSYCVGLVAAEREDMEVIPKLAEWLIDADWNGFVLAFKPSEDYLKEMIMASCFSQSNLAKKIERRGIDVESMSEAFEGLSIDEKIKHVNNQLFEGEFYMLSEYLDFMPTILSHNGKFDLMVDLLDRYSLPEIQIEVIQALSNPEDLLKLFDAVSASSFGEEKKRVIMQLIINYWIKCLIGIKSNYALSLPAYAKDADLKEKWESLRDEFDNSLPLIINSSFTHFIGGLPKKDLVYWLFTIPYPLSSIDNEHNNATRTILDLSREELISISSSKDFNDGVHDLAYLEAYAGFLDYFKEDDIAGKLSQLILESLSKDKYFLLGALNNDLVARIHNLAFAIIKGTGQEAGMIFDNWYKSFRVKFEGIKPTPQNERYDKALFESQFLLIIIYAVVFNENQSQKEEDFLRISRYILSQCRDSHRGDYDKYHYIRVLIFAEMIASQAIPEVKDIFDTQCIQTYPYIYSLLKVFNHSSDVLADNIRTWIDSQCQNEWQIIKKRMINRKQMKEVEWAENVLGSKIINP